MTDINGLPDRLRNTGRFCCWRWETDRDGRKTKVLYDPKTGVHGSAADPDKFTHLDAAARVLKAYDGLGVGIFDRIGAIDMDHCLNKNGEPSPEAAAVMGLIRSYAEVSPSGDGIHMFFTAPAGFKYDTDAYYINNRSKKIKPVMELYLPGMTKRFLTVTGNVIDPGEGDGLPEVSPDTLQTILDKYMRKPVRESAAAAYTYTAPSVPVDLTDFEIIRRLQNDPKFSDLFAGDWQALYNSQSEADQALCAKLAFWTGGDPVRIDSLFRQSGLYRQKWERQKYRDDTVRKGIEECNGEYYDPDYYKRQNEADDRAGLQRMKENARDHRSDDGGPGTAGSVSGSNSTAATGNAVSNGSGALENKTQAPEDIPPELAARIAEFGPDMGPFINEIYTERYKPVATGIKALDDFLHGGLIRQTLVLLSAEPGAGKTILTTQICESMARQGIDVIYFNLEMSKSQLLARSLARILYTDFNWRTNAVEILQGYNHDDRMRERVEAAARKYAAEVEPHMKYNPIETADFDEIKKYIIDAGQHAERDGRPGPCIALDYLHILHSAPGLKEDASSLIKRAVADLKAYAARYNSVVIAIGAQNRQANKSSKADIAAGRDSSAIEYSGDLILQLISNDKVDKKHGDPDRVNLYVTKSRFTAFDKDNGLPFIKHGGQSYFEQVGQWTGTPVSDTRVSDQEDDDTGSVNMTV